MPSKSLGQIAYEAWTVTEYGYPQADYFSDNVDRDSWEAAASAVVTEHNRRQPRNHARPQSRLQRAHQQTK